MLRARLYPADAVHFDMDLEEIRRYKVRPLFAATVVCTMYDQMFQSLIFGEHPKHGFCLHDLVFLGCKINTTFFKVESADGRV